MAGRKPHLSHGNLGYTALPTKRLLRFTAGLRQPIVSLPFTSFDRVAFVPGTSTGYLLAAIGEVLETRTNGEMWHLLASQAVHKLHPSPQGITWLQEKNQLVFYPTSGKQ